MDITQKNIWHHRTFESVFKEFNSHITGISFAQADERLKLYGFNILPEIKKEVLLLFSCASFTIY